MRPFLRFSNPVSLRFMINYPSQRRCGQSPSNPIDVVSRKPQLPLNSLHFELILHPALLPFHYIHTVLAAFAEAEKRIQEQLCRLSYCTSGEWASFKASTNRNLLSSRAANDYSIQQIDCFLFLPIIPFRSVWWCTYPWKNLKNLDHKCTWSGGLLLAWRLRFFWLS